MMNRIFAPGLVVFLAVQALAAAAEKQEKNSSSEKHEAIAAQVLLDRAGFSPGEIDGQWGSNAKNALNAFQESQGLPASEEVDDKTSAALSAVGGAYPALTDYLLSEEDVAGPFVTQIPKEMKDKATLPALGYTNVQEMLGERFHIEPELLKTLNPESKFAAGDQILVPNVEPTPIGKKAASKTDGASDKEKKAAEKSKDEPKSDKSDSMKTDSGTQENKTALRTTDASETTLSLPQRIKPDGPITITVSKAKSSLVVRDKEDKIIFAAPVTTGSEHDPLPIGEWKVNGTERYPSFNYNPDLFWDAKPKDEKAKLPSGPNNPVGVAWIDITKEHYGLHGTPEPGTVGHTESHGCVRLTNWDVLRLAELVKKGTKVVFEE